VSSTPAQAKKKTDDLAAQVKEDENAFRRLRDELKIVNSSIDSWSGKVSTAKDRVDEAKSTLAGLTAKVESLNNAF
jgi:chromosome segregation ATPase